MGEPRACCLRCRLDVAVMVTGQLRPHLMADPPSRTDFYALRWHVFRCGSWADYHRRGR